MPRNARPVLALVLAGAVLTAVTACGGTDAESAGSTAAEPAARSDVVAGSADSGGGAAGSGGVAQGSPGKGTGSTGSAASAAQQRLVRTAEVTVEVNQLATSVATVRSIANRLGGFVSSEATGLLQPVNPAQERTVTSNGTVFPAPPPARNGESVVVIRVPEPKLDQAVDLVGGVGKVRARSASSEDVTAELADLDSRLATQRRSVERVRALLTRAGTLQDVVLLESELGKRESDLEALEARQRALADRATLATLTVTLQTPAVEPTPAKDEIGFLTGLRSGWHALLRSTQVILTVLGALLPVTVVVAILAWPALLLWRRRVRTRRPAPTQPVATPPGG